MANPAARSIFKSGQYLNPTPIEIRSLYKSKVTPKKRAGKSQPFSKMKSSNTGVSYYSIHQVMEYPYTQFIKYQSIPVLKPSNNRVTQYSKYF